MTKKDISKSVLKKIKKDHITPKAKWEFLLKNYVLWGSFVILILVGALAASVVIFRMHTHDWDIHHHLGEHFSIFTLKNLPYFWLLLLVAFVFIAYYNFKHTKKGYKYGLPLIIGSSILISGILGAAFFGIGVAKHLEDKALNHLPFYKEISLKKRMGHWSHPEKGLLAGEVIEVFEDGNFSLESFEGGQWKIVLGELKPHMKKHIAEESVIGLFGEKIDDTSFKAEKIRPWKGNFIRPPRPHKGHKKSFLKEKFKGPRNR